LSLRSVIVCSLMRLRKDRLPSLRNARRSLVLRDGQLHVSSHQRFWSGRWDSNPRPSPGNEIGFAAGDRGAAQTAHWIASLRPPAVACSPKSVGEMLAKTRRHVAHPSRMR
jgi:hypothetical protein